ncbi:E7 [Gammapapillomavirus 13]|uniref:Protein E7 n=1 Tax=Gammapapillomavirus 13 TaxID=1513258 RepID=A0A2D2ALQ3_9PAPI|nr:E7 [Gammapapillomavirus 13]
MRSNRPTIQDINLELHDLVLPVDLLANESLSPDDIPEEEQLSPYQIDTSCGTCRAGVRIVIVTSVDSLILFQQLLASDLQIVCPRCSRGHFHHGRS